MTTSRKYTPGESLLDHLGAKREDMKEGGDVGVDGITFDELMALGDSVRADYGLPTRVKVTVCPPTATRTDGTTDWDDDTVCKTYATLTMPRIPNPGERIEHQGEKFVVDTVTHTPDSNAQHARLRCRQLTRP